jgi:hypothetical protein
MSANGVGMEPGAFVELIQGSEVGDVVKLQIRRVIDYDEGTYKDLEVEITIGNMPPKPK